MPLKTFSVFALLIAAWDLLLLSVELAVLVDAVSDLLLEQEIKMNSKQIRLDKLRSFFIFIYLRMINYDAFSIRKKG